MGHNTAACSDIIGQWSVLIFLIMLSQVKWAVDNKLLHTDIDDSGYAAAIRGVLEHKSLRDKFCGVRAELAELGYTGVEVTQAGLGLTRTKILPTLTEI